MDQLQIVPSPTHGYVPFDSTFATSRVSLYWTTRSPQYSTHQSSIAFEVRLVGVAWSIWMWPFQMAKCVSHTPYSRSLGHHNDTVQLFAQNNTASIEMKCLTLFYTTECTPGDLIGISKWWNFHPAYRWSYYHIDYICQILWTPVEYRVGGLKY